MTALPINPTREQLTAWVAATGLGWADTHAIARAAHQAGVEAERARAAAEKTTDILAGINDTLYDDGFQAGLAAERTRAAAEATVEWGVRDEDGDVLRRPTEDRARRFGKTTGLPVVRRTVHTSPWEETHADA